MHKVIKIKNGRKIEITNKNKLNKASRFLAKKGNIIGSREKKSLKLMKTQLIKGRDQGMKKNMKSNKNK